MPIATLPVDFRQPAGPTLKDAITAHLATIPEGKRAAMLLIVDESGARVHLAAKIDDHWKVAFEAGKPWNEPVKGFVALQGSW